MKSFCISCGDLIRKPPENEPFGVQDAMRVYCLECAREIITGQIGRMARLHHDSGGGRRVIRETKTH